MVAAEADNVTVIYNNGNFKTGTSLTSLSYFYVQQPNGSFTTTQWGNGFDYLISTLRAY